MTQEALKLSLEYIQAVPDDRYNAKHIDRDALITAIKEALAQPEQEPVAWMHQNKFTGKATIIWDLGLATPNQNWKPLYTTPPQRTWLELTDETISEIAINNPPMVHEFARAIEAKLKEKNT